MEVIDNFSVSTGSLFYPLQDLPLIWIIIIENRTRFRALFGGLLFYALMISLDYTYWLAWYRIRNK